MKVFALTPTGSRPEGLALLGEYLNAQTYTEKIVWIVVDDCDPLTRIPTMRDAIDVVSVRPTERWRRGLNTHAKSLLAGLDHVPDDAALIMLEDDDVYLPEHVSDSLRALERCELTGEIDSQYYNVKTRRWRVLRGRFHASFASTSMRGSAIDCLRQVCSSGRERMLDVTLWKTFKGKKHLTRTHNVVGIKGLTGRAGIGVGHKSTFGTPDNDDRLRTWIGERADNYQMFSEHT